MDIDAFLERVAADGLQLPPTAAGPRRAPETIDALFHLPLIALAMMVVVRRTPFRPGVLGRNVAMLLVEQFAALRRSSHGLETSLMLRRRCADALAFLEAAELVIVSEDRQRFVSLTQSGRSYLSLAVRDTSDLGLLVRQFQTSQERVRARSGSDER